MKWVQMTRSRLSSLVFDCLQAPGCCQSKVHLIDSSDLALHELAKLLFFESYSTRAQPIVHRGLREIEADDLSQQSSSMR